MKHHFLRQIPFSDGDIIFTVAFSVIVEHSGPWVVSYCMDADVTARRVIVEVCRYMDPYILPRVFVGVSLGLLTQFALSPT